MKALVLAGGSGTRLRPFTHTTPKQLVPVGDRPVLFHGLEAIKKTGITSVGIVVGRSGTCVRNAVGTGAAFGLDVEYIPQDKPMGLAHGVLIARDFLGDDDFVMYLGDNVILEGIEGLVREFERHRPDAMLTVGHLSNRSDFGFADVNSEGRVTRLVEKPEQPRDGLAVIGAYAFSPSIHQAVRSIRPSWRHEQEITHALSWLVDQDHTVLAHEVDGYWQDTGHVDDLLDCNRAVLEQTDPQILGDVDAGSELSGRVFVNAGARISGSRILGPTVVGVGSTITDSVIGPNTSIGTDCEVTGSEVLGSIVMDEASISGVRRVQDSVVGRRARVGSAAAVPRLVVGDDSDVLLS